MSTRADVLLWAQRVLAKQNPQPHELLEIKQTAGVDDAQAAFHKIAKMAHPDLHKVALSPEDLELVTRAYSKITNAYMEFRASKMTTARIKAVQRTSDAVERAPGGAPPTETRPRGSSPTTPPPTTTPTTTPTMTPKALVYYRKAELALRRGDLTGAVLQLKMAIATDPQSPFLRTALAEVQAEVGKKP
jgi:hypothetical protein